MGAEIRSPIVENKLSQVVFQARPQLVAFSFESAVVIRLSPSFREA